MATVRHFPQLRDYPGRVRLEALLGGTLVIENGCFRTRGAAGETRLLVWAPDAVLLPDHRSVRSGRSGAIARTGDEISFSGGHAPSGGLRSHPMTGTLPDECPGPYAIMSEGFSIR